MPPSTEVKPFGRALVSPRSQTLLHSRIKSDHPSRPTNLAVPLFIQKCLKNPTRKSSWLPVAMVSLYELAFRPIPKSEGDTLQGSHISRRLFQTRNAYYRIRIIDIAPDSLLRQTICHEFMQGNLCDFQTAQHAVRDAHAVLHFAATMGGMGTIHEKNDFVIYEENHTMTSNILHACVTTPSVKRLLLASSACVYPDSLQHLRNSRPTNGVSLRESDVWSDLPPRPQGLYGLEKLFSEILAQNMPGNIDIRIARFHNVYGPGCAWENGREKAPAAMIRKAYALKNITELGHKDVPFPIWGDGKQSRSFLYIDDAVEAVIRLLDSTNKEPLNIGSDSSVTVKELADIALECAGVEVKGVKFSYEKDKPTGVGARNSNNELVRSTIGWDPVVSLRHGMQQMGDWVEREMRMVLEHSPDRASKTDALLKLMESRVVDLETEGLITFAILLPITSRGSAAQDDCLVGLRRFAQSLVSTTCYDTRALGTTRYRFRIYFVIDRVDAYLLQSSGGLDRPTIVVHEARIHDTVSLESDAPPGRVCDLWRLCARRAYNDGCDYFVLMGDDVILQDEGWMRTVHAEFARISSEMRMPFGFGCVALTDTSFPGMPTFPVIHRTHMEIFNGEVVPEAFINQDGDPFLFQLYRRWGCSAMVEKRIVNNVGGPGAARYEKQHAKDWVFEQLAGALSNTKTWLESRGVDMEENLAFDVVIPSYRVDLEILSAILELKHSKSCSVMFIIIVDDPNSPRVAELEKR